MIIINEGADYSACGLGKFFPLTNEIKNLLYTGYGNRVTKAQMFAFQQFAGAIGWGESDLYAKIKLLTIPMFNGGQKDTGVFFNLKTGTKALVGQSSGVMNVRDDNFTDYWDNKAEGARPIYRNVNNEMCRFFEFTPAPKDFSIICAYYTTTTGGIQNSNGVPIALEASKIIYRKYDGSTVLSLDNVANDGILVASSVNDGHDVVYTKNTEKAQTDGTTLSSSGTLYPNYGMWSNYRPSSVGESYNVLMKVYGYAEGLTTSEASILRDALKSLCQDLGWNLGYNG